MKIPESLADRFEIHLNSSLFAGWLTASKYLTAQTGCNRVFKKTIFGFGIDVLSSNVERRNAFQPSYK
jgi:hypothetical protein